MSTWPEKPFIYEINTWVWLKTLSQTYHKSIKLGNIPEEVIDGLASYQVNAVWMMGVWHRSTAVRASALNYIHEYRHALSDIRAADVIGSAYAIGDYIIDARIGGRDGLAVFRKQLEQRGIKLILDFVPNHVATDHPWIKTHPEYFITGTIDDLARDNHTFYMTTDAEGHDLVVAHGRDPYFPAWIDTAQFNAFNPGFRQAALDTLLDIADQCDGVRCDMAMLMMNSIFSTTWRDFAGNALQQDFWLDIIPPVKSRHADFIFMAEVYWDLEYELQQHGFDYTYDKTLYDRMLAGDAEQIQQHLWADLTYQKKSIRFIENHDETRAASSMGIEKSRAAATLIMTLPGGVLLHDGQFVGRRVKLPVQISRQPNEKPNWALDAFYHRLLNEANSAIYREGAWRLFEVRHAYECPEEFCPKPVVYGWSKGDTYRLIVINMSGRWIQSRLRLHGWENLSGKEWRLHHILHDVYRNVSGQQVISEGLYIELDPYEAIIYDWQPA